MEALRLEVKKRENVEVPIIPVYKPKKAMLKETLPDSVTLQTEDGARTYYIPKEKIEHSLIREREKRILLTILFEDYPLALDSFDFHWDSILNAGGIRASHSLRYCVTDSRERTVITYSKGVQSPLAADSLISCYMGVRCEMEVTGYVVYEWWHLMEWWQWLVLCFPYLAMTILCFFNGYARKIFQYMFVRHEVVAVEKVVAIEKVVTVEKVIHVADVRLEEAKTYCLGGSIYLDLNKKLLYENQECKTLPPQLFKLLILFLESSNGKLSNDEIMEGIWQKKVGLDLVNNLIRRLRIVLKSFPSLIVSYDGNGDYKLQYVGSQDGDGSQIKEPATDKH